MLEGGLVVTNVTPKCSQVFKWVLDAKELMTEQIVKNSWLHAEYSYFEK